MNTDNMSIHGLTIDYSPYGWLEDYSPAWTPNTTDKSHRVTAMEINHKLVHRNVARFLEAISHGRKQG